MSKKSDEMRPTHALSLVPLRRNAKGKEVRGKPRNIGAVSFPPGLRDVKFRFFCRRSTDIDPGAHGILIARRFKPSCGR